MHELMLARDVGPVEAALRQYTGGYGAVGLVFGAYGECSSGVIELMQLLAKKLAENWRQMGAVSKEVAAWVGRGATAAARDGQVGEEVA